MGSISGRTGALCFALCLCLYASFEACSVPIYVPETWGVDGQVIPEGSPEPPQERVEGRGGDGGLSEPSDESPTEPRPTEPGTQERIERPSEPLGEAPPPEPDCTKVPYYKDADGDTFGSNTQVLMACPGQAPRGYVTRAGDCDDLDDRAHPNQTVYFTGRTKGTKSYDYDCDGKATPLYTALFKCELSRGCVGPQIGFHPSVPGCGAVQNYYKACAFSAGRLQCSPTMPESRRQRCR